MQKKLAALAAMFGVAALSGAPLTPFVPKANNSETDAVRQIKAAAEDRRQKRRAKLLADKSIARLNS